MNNQARAEPGRIRYSITRKLNNKLFFRLLGLFFSLNIMICIIAGVSLAFYCETKVISALERLSELEPPMQGEWMEMAGMSIRSLPEPTIWQTIPWPFSNYISYEPETAVRGFRAVSDGFRNTIHSIAYVVSVGVDIFEAGGAGGVLDAVFAVYAGGSARRGSTRS